MKIGTKSLLFGAHQVFIHPIFVAWAWVKLYGWTWNPAHWVAFVVHDWGYWGKPDMDGEQGESHPYLGAKILSFLFDVAGPGRFEVWPWSKPNLWRALSNDARVGCTVTYDPMGNIRLWVRGTIQTEWRDFSLYHSRFLAKAHGKPFSRLCVADKLATCLEPRWLYLARVRATGEVEEYMARAGNQPGSKYREETLTPEERNRLDTGDIVSWYEVMTDHLRRWVEANKDVPLF